MDFVLKKREIRQDLPVFASLRLGTQDCLDVFPGFAAFSPPRLQAASLALADILLGQFILHGSIFSAKSGRFSRFALHRISKQI